MLLSCLWNLPEPKTLMVFLNTHKYLSSSHIKLADAGFYCGPGGLPGYA